VPDNELYPLADELPGSRCGLFSIAKVVCRNKIHLFTEDTSRGIDFNHGPLCAALHLLARPGILSGHRPRDTNQDVRMGAESGKGSKPPKP
jgi:hypothetical protein